MKILNIQVRETDSGRIVVINGDNTTGIAYREHRYPELGNIVIASGDEDSFNMCRDAMTTLVSGQKIRAIKFWEAFKDGFEISLSTYGGGNEYFGCSGEIAKYYKEDYAHHSPLRSIRVNPTHISAVYSEIRISIQRIEKFYQTLYTNATEVFKQEKKINWLQNRVIHHEKFDIRTDQDMVATLRFLDSIDSARLGPLLNNIELVSKGCELVDFSNKIEISKAVRLTRSLTLVLDNGFSLSGYRIRNTAVGPYLAMIGKMKEVEIKLQKASIQSI